PRRQAAGGERRGHRRERGGGPERDHEPADAERVGREPGAELGRRQAPPEGRHGERDEQHGAREEAEKECGRDAGGAHATAHSRAAAGRGTALAVQRSESRILTTHAGSLPRTPELTALLVRRSRREPVESAELERAIRDSTRRVVARQLAAGVDVGNDGEQARESFFTYVQHRMSGFGGTGERPIMRDITHFPSYLALRLPDFSRTQVSLMAAPKAVGEVRYVDRAALERECALLQEVVREQDGRFVEPFMTAPSPGDRKSTRLNSSHVAISYAVFCLKKKTN